MPLSAAFQHSVSLPGAPGVRLRRVNHEQWREFAQAFAAAGGRLLSLWAQDLIRDSQSMLAALIAEPGVLLLELPLDGERYPGLQGLFPGAARMQRAVADLSGILSDDTDVRPWLWHGRWPSGFRPLRDRESGPRAPDADRSDDYAFVRVEGDGVHEIAVGPVHAGIIEPGHFRFSVVGEKVLRLEQHLGYVHKGMERRFTQLPLLQGHRLAARVSGDSAVAFSWAYCQAAEGLAEVTVPSRALWLRALALEIERIANHLGDLGALGNDSGFAFALAQFSLLKETLLRATEQAFGQRYLMDFIVPGGTRVDLDATSAAPLGACIRGLVTQVQHLREILEEHAGVRDRFFGAGLVPPPLARRLGLAGLAGRASGQGHDLRVDLPCAPYEQLQVRACVRDQGDVAARVAVRFDELLESARLVGRILQAVPAGPHQTECAPPRADRLGVGLIEGWRGPVMIALSSGEAGSIRRCHPHDPSWQNWPLLEHAIIGNIVPDFPLINKSFNLSYSGVDL
jgi:Ni,Fe-hydrogenase III large subunit/Ni,Fe-hydrogenase III component G